MYSYRCPSILNTIKFDFEFIIGTLCSKQIVKARFYSHQVFLIFLLIWLVLILCLSARLFVFVNQILRRKEEGPYKSH